MNSELLELKTKGQTFIDISEAVAAFCSKQGGDGLVSVFVPHATAGTAILETGAGTEPDNMALGTWPGVVLVDPNAR